MANDLIPLLRKLFGLSTDAAESVILSQLGARDGELRAALERKPVFFLSAGAKKALDVADQATADEVSAKIVELSLRASNSTALAGRIAALEGDQIAGEVEAAIAAFKLDPAERDEQIAFGKADPAMFRKLLSKRVPRQLNAEVKVNKNEPRSTSAFAAQQKAVAEYLAAHKDATHREALVACAAAQPDLFESIVDEENTKPMPKGV